MNLWDTTPYAFSSSHTSGPPESPWKYRDGFNAESVITYDFVHFMLYKKTYLARSNLSLGAVQVVLSTQLIVSEFNIDFHEYYRHIFVGLVCSPPAGDRT